MHVFICLYALYAGDSDKQQSAPVATRKSSKETWVTTLLDFLKQTLLGSQSQSNSNMRIHAAGLFLYIFFDNCLTRSHCLFLSFFLSFVLSLFSWSNFENVHFFIEQIFQPAMLVYLRVAFEHGCQIRSGC